jgi:hypothetical protein
MHSTIPEMLLFCVANVLSYDMTLVVEGGGERGGEKDDKTRLT